VFEQDRELMEDSEMDKWSIEIVTEWVAYSMRNSEQEMEFLQFLDYLIRFEGVKKNKPQFQRLTLDQFVKINLKYHNNEKLQRIQDLLKGNPEIQDDALLFAKKAVTWYKLIRPFTIVMGIILIAVGGFLTLRHEWLWLVTSVIGLAITWFVLIYWMLKKFDEYDAKARELARKLPGLLEALEDFNNELDENGDQEMLLLLI